MSCSGKLVLSLALLFCVLQASVARPHFDGNFVESVRYDLMRKCSGLERDFAKETMSANHKVMKEAAKLMKKAVKGGSQECVEAARLQAEEQLEEKSQETQDCIGQLKDSLDSSLTPESTLPEIMSFRSDFKNKLQGCKNTGKMELKAVLNEFSTAGKSCLI